MVELCGEHPADSVGTGETGQVTTKISKLNSSFITLEMICSPNKTLLCSKVPVITVHKSARKHVVIFILALCRYDRRPTGLAVQLRSVFLSFQVFDLVTCFCLVI